MTERSVAHATFCIERSYGHPPATVFNAFADPVIKRRWFVDGEGWEIESYASDFRVGGLETSVFRFRVGERITNDTVYQDIVPDERIVIAYYMAIGDKRISASLATMEFRAEGGGTRLVFTEQDAFLDGHDKVDAREAGTRELLEALSRELDRDA